MELSGADFFSPVSVETRRCQALKIILRLCGRNSGLKEESCVFAVEAANRLISFISSYKFIYIYSYI